MPGVNRNPESFEPKSREMGNTEHSWCRAVAGGTGVTVLALEIARPVGKTLLLLRDILEKMQHLHPLLLSSLKYNATTKEFSLVKSATTHQFPIKFHDVPSTCKLLLTLTAAAEISCGGSVSSLHLISQHELNSKNWHYPTSFPCNGMDLMFASVYALCDTKSVIVLKLHASICDRATAVSFLRELMELAVEVEGGLGPTGIKVRNKVEGEGNMGIESLIPSGMTKKTIWAHGIDMLGYSVNSLRITNLKFKNPKSPRCSEIIRFRFNTQITARILAGCKSRGIKLCGALAAAGLISAHSDHHLKKKYGVVTLTDCRSVLEPPLPTHHYGFYHSAILNIHAMKGSYDRKLWDLATICYSDFEHSKKCNRHFSDMADLNFLMCRAIENPGLTASSSLRTSLISVFEDPVIDNSSHMQQVLGVEDYLGCASVHGVGPSIGFFDTIRDGELDCTCVYPSPLHSREQMTELVDRMKKILIEECSD